MPVSYMTVCFNFMLSCLLYTSDAADEEDSVDLGVKNYRLKANITGGKRSRSSSAKQKESVIEAELKRCGRR